MIFEIGSSLNVIPFECQFIILRESSSAG
jgi:hypothetical protein